MHSWGSSPVLCALLQGLSWQSGPMAGSELVQEGITGRVMLSVLHWSAHRPASQRAEAPAFRSSPARGAQALSRSPRHPLLQLPLAELSLPAASPVLPPRSLHLKPAKPSIVAQRPRAQPGIVPSQEAVSHASGEHSAEPVSQPLPCLCLMGGGEACSLQSVTHIVVTN